MDKENIRQIYEKFSGWYDLAEGGVELLGLSRLRRRLIRRAEGEVLEIAAGTGRNFPYYTPAVKLTAVDLSPSMLKIAEKKASRLGLSASCRVMDAEALEFPDHSFDTVVTSLTLCTFPNNIKALHEMARVCRPGGKILLLEHGRSHASLLARLQDWYAPSHYRQMGCQWNLEPLDIVRQSGLGISDFQSHFFGIFHIIIAYPTGLKTPHSTS